MKKIRTYLNWSSGKDAAMALHYLQESKTHEVVHLLTSVNAHHGRVSMHGVRRALLEAQVAATGLPCSTIELPEQPDMGTYEEYMFRAVHELSESGCTCAAFGDIFLEDLRAYREQQLKKANMQAYFPLWKKDTRSLLHEFLDTGFKAIVVCTDARLLDKSFAGRIIDRDFIKDLPPGVDPCGERGEFHTFCFDAPYFKHPVAFEAGERIYRTYESPGADDDAEAGFWFCDLINKESDVHT